MSDFYLESVSQISDEKLLEDKKFDAEQIYKDFKKEIVISSASALCSSDSSIDASQLESL